MFQWQKGLMISPFKFTYINTMSMVLMFLTLLSSYIKLGNIICIYFRIFVLLSEAQTHSQYSCYQKRRINQYTNIVGGLKTRQCAKIYAISKRNGKYMTKNLWCRNLSQQTDREPLRTHFGGLKSVCNITINRKPQKHINGKWRFHFGFSKIWKSPSKSFPL